MYKILAIDADGTLLNDDSKIPAVNIEAVRKAQEKGVRIVLCSGRAFPSLLEFSETLALNPETTHVISFNGSIVLDGFGCIIRDVRMKGTTAQYILEKLKAFPATVAVYSEADIMLCEKPAPEIARYTSGVHVTPVYVKSLAEAAGRDVYKVVVVGEPNALSEIAEFMLEDAKNGGPVYDMVVSGKRLLEFSDIRAVKGDGLRCVCDALGLDASRDAIMIGDSFNDISALKSAALGVAMAGSPREVQAAAAYVTARDNNNGGVAEVIEKYILSI